MPNNQAHFIPCTPRQVAVYDLTHDRTVMSTIDGYWVRIMDGEPPPGGVGVALSGSQWLMAGPNYASEK